VITDLNIISDGIKTIIKMDFYLSVLGAVMVMGIKVFINLLR
jgi:hypothetical protein